MKPTKEHRWKNFPWIDSVADLEGANEEAKLWQIMDNQFKKSDKVQVCETMNVFALF